jgi:hypothetical protein
MNKPKNLASNNNTVLNTEVGSHSLHLFMTHWTEDNEIDKSISMHLSLEEVERLIKELKHRLVGCYKARVEAL